VKMFYAAFGTLFHCSDADCVLLHIAIRFVRLMNLVILCHNYYTNLHYIFAKDMITLITIYLIDFYLF